MFGVLLCQQILRIKITGLVRHLPTARRVCNCPTGYSTIAEGVFFSSLRQIGIQILEAPIGFTWSTVGTYLTVAVIDRLRAARLKVLSICCHKFPEEKRRSGVHERRAW